VKLLRAKGNGGRFHTQTGREPTNSRAKGGRGGGGLKEGSNTGNKKISRGGKKTQTPLKRNRNVEMGGL